MVTESSRVFFTTAAVALLASVFYGASTGDHAGLTLLLSLSVVAFSVGLIVARARVNQVAVPVPASAGPPQLLPVSPTRRPGGGVWPITAAASLGLTMVGFVLGPAAAFAGIALGVATVAGWLAVVAAEDTGRPITLLPLGLPVVGLTAIGSLMFLMSRILLAVSEKASTWIALAVAIVIMAAASILALRPRVSTGTLTGILAVGSLLMFSGGLVAAAVGERHIEHHGPVHPEAVKVAAAELAFDVKELHLPANAAALIEFENEETVPHNVAIYRDAEGTQPVFVGDVVVGPLTIEYNVPPTPPGNYPFRCDIHPNMAGTAIVA